MKLSIWLIFSASFLFSPLHAQPRRLTFEQISIEQGLSQSIVYCILQDHKGFLWFGTEDGLNNDYILCLHADQAGVLWLGTWGGGLNKFDREKGVLAYYTTREGLPNNEIYGILEDGGGNFWISSNRGLSRFNPTTEVFKITASMMGAKQGLCFFI
jgi:ligand-binding sensor domain-containing protein